MPAQKVKGGWRWGTKGKVYRGPGAYKKALKQGAAINIAKKKRKKGRR